MLDLVFTDLEQDIILLTKGHEFTDDFIKLHKELQKKNKSLTRLQNIIILHQEYYGWGNKRYYLGVIYNNFLNICYKLFYYRVETEFQIKYYLERIMQSAINGEWKESIDIKHIINNLISLISLVRVMKDDEELFELKGKYVEEL